MMPPPISGNRTTHSAHAARELAHGVGVAILPDGAERDPGEPPWNEPR